MLSAPLYTSFVIPSLFSLRDFSKSVRSLFLNSSLVKLPNKASLITPCIACFLIAIAEGSKSLMASVNFSDICSVTLCISVSLKPVGALIPSFAIISSAFDTLSCTMSFVLEFSSLCFFNILATFSLSIFNSTLPLRVLSRAWPGTIELDGALDANNNAAKGSRRPSGLPTFSIAARHASLAARIVSMSSRFIEASKAWHSRLDA
mmetsp:Transcript_82869/g.130609  ORF Transcript_82869/g.130609 Transcript_82869/m.130609 type:complete len:205 (+) Transcript_82869:310-924(+)